MIFFLYTRTVLVCIITINSSRKSREINYLTMSGNYRLTKINTAGYIPYPDSKNYIRTNHIRTLPNTRRAVLRY